MWRYLEISLYRGHQIKARLLLLLLSRFSRVWLCATPQTAAHQAPPSLGFSRQEHWSGVPFPSPMHENEKRKWSRSVVSDSSRPHGLQPTRLLRPWEFPGKSTGVGCHCLQQCWRRRRVAVLLLHGGQKGSVFWQQCLWQVEIPRGLKPLLQIGGEGVINHIWCGWMKK